MPLAQNQASLEMSYVRVTVDEYLHYNAYINLAYTIVE